MAKRVIDHYRKLSGLPFGRWLFSRMICFRAPYFGSIRPLFVSLEPERCHVTMKRRRAVKNHLGGVHALAMGNLCELAAGLVTEVSKPETMRWIPRGMTIRYLKLALSDVDAVAEFPELDGHDKQNVIVPVSVKNRDGETVVTADITMYLSPRD